MKCLWKSNLIQIPESWLLSLSKEAVPALYRTSFGISNGRSNPLVRPKSSPLLVWVSKYSTVLNHCLRFIKGIFFSGFDLNCGAFTVRTEA